MENTTIPEGTIVVGIDGSKASERALGWATEQAQIEHRSLTLVHGAGPANLGWSVAPGVSMGDLTEVVRTAGRALLDRAEEIVAELAPGVETRTVLEMVEPRTLLIGLSESAALMVVGSHGRGPIAGMLLGSVSQALTRHASCPVVIQRAGDLTLAQDGCLVGVDGSEGSRAAIEFAFRQASERSMPLTLMHCFWDMAHTFGKGGEVAADEPGLDVQRELVSEATSGLREAFPDVVVHTRLVRGSADDSLPAASATMDMVVVGAPAQSAVAAFFGVGVDDDVLGRSSCLVAVVPVAARERLLTAR